MVRFNRHLDKCNTRFRPLIGATIQQMETYVQPTLIDDTPDVAILHIGCNDIPNKFLTPQEIAEGIVNIGRYCLSKNVNHVFISSLICRQHGFYNKRVADVNSILQIICWENGLGFIDNSNIGVEKLADGLHLNYMGTKDLANNYIYCLNKFVL